MSSWYGLPIFTHHGSHVASGALQVLHEGTSSPTCNAVLTAKSAQGNCKFGAKCALAHFLPNGHRVSKADLDPTMAMNRQSSTTARDAPPPPFPAFDPAFNEPFLGQQGAIPSYFSGNGTGIGPDIPFPLEDDSDVYQDRYSHHYSNGNGYDRPVGSPSTSQFGSPPNEMRFGNQHWPSAKDAPLPPSYKNQVPNYAIKGPFGSSVPDKFGLGSPTSSSISQAIGSPPARDLQLQTSSNSAVKTNPLGASPGAQAVDSIHRRMMHSDRLAREAKGGLASSLPVRNLDDDFGIGSSLLPSVVRDEVMTPEERRQNSKAEQEPIGSWKDRSAGLAIPRRSSNVVGSPPAASSPSRFQSIFEEQRRERNSTIGSVGSPLRENWFPDGNSSISGRPGAQMSGISQAMARMELNRTDSTESNGQRNAGLRGGFSRIDRQISSPGITPKRIDEEGEGAFFGFEMDDDGTKRIQNWADNTNVGRKSEDSNTTQGRPIGIKNVNRPFFGGFQP